MITYFVQVNVCWLLFYGAYFALLSRETFFRLNRMWLIISLLGGLVLPRMAPTLDVVEPTNVAVVMLQPFVVTAVDLGQNLQNTEGSLFKILAAIYGLGLAITLGKLLFGFWKIKRLHRRAERLPMPDFTLMQVREAIAPFSFFRWVFINLNLVQSADLQQIILHERAHVRERHSFDVMFVELLGVIFWWSPLVHFYTKSLKNVHEYAADAAVLRTSSPPQYGRLLLRQQQSGMSLSLTNPFFSQLKKRILMMTRNPSKRRALVKYALAVPIFLVLTLLLASPKTKIMATTEAATERAVASIETFEKNLRAPQIIDNELITPVDLANMLNDSTITGAQGQVFTLDGRTPSSEQLMSIEQIHALKKFSVGDFIKLSDGHFKRLDNGAFTIVRISRKDGTVRIRNVGSAFSADVLELVRMAELGDTYQFFVEKKIVANGKTMDAPPFTYFIGDAPMQFNHDALNAEQQARLAKIAENPVVLLAGKRGGVITPDNLAQQDKLEAFQVINGKTVAVEIVSFILFRVPKVGDPMQSNNASGQFNSETKRMVDMAVIGDAYQFMEIKCRVKGEIAPFNAGWINFVVKSLGSSDGAQNAFSIANSSELPIASFGGKYRTGMIAAKDLTTPNKLEAFQNINGKVTPVEVLSFVLGRVAFTRDENDSEWITSYNVGPELNAKSKQLLKMAAKHDTYTFTEIKCRIKGVKIPIEADRLSFFVERTPPQYFAKKDSSDPVFTKADYEPTFVGGQDSMFRFLGRNIKYPAEARELSVEGTVYLEFIVEKDGSLTNVTIKRNIPESQTRVDTIVTIDPQTYRTTTKIVKYQDENCAEEAMRVVKLMPKWRPGLLKGAPIRVCYILPIKFRLE